MLTMLRRTGRRSTDPLIDITDPTRPLTAEEIAEHAALDAELALHVDSRELLSDVLTHLGVAALYSSNGLSTDFLYKIADRIRAARDDRGDLHRSVPESLKAAFHG